MCAAGLLAACAALVGRSSAPGASATTPRSAAASTVATEIWSASIGSNVELSSPTYGTIGGVRVVAAGSLDGRVYLFDALTGAAMPGWAGGRPAVMRPGEAPSAIDSSPTIAYLDGPAKPPSIVVGVGSQSVRNQDGGVIAWNASGSVRFVFHTKHTFDQWSGETGRYDNSVFATPAVGPVQGSGQQDIVFGSFDHYIYALGPRGGLLPGFPIQRADTIWSSAALVDTTRSGRDDIIMGGDAAGYRSPSGEPCYGGWVTDYRYVPSARAPRLVWERCMGQSIWSSPAVGVLNGTGRLAVVVGTSFNSVYRSDAATNELFAFYASDGAPVPGWPVRTVGPSFGSPVIARLTPGGSPVVVSTSCASCMGGPAEVAEWTGAGRPVWSRAVTPRYEMLSSPAVANVTGEGGEEVLVGITSGVYILDGASGRFAYSGPLADGCRVDNTPAVFQVPRSDRVPSGWELVLSCTKRGAASVDAFALAHAPDQTPSWPQWRANGDHSGYVPGA